MSNRRMDAIYFLVFLSVLAVGYGIAQTDDEAGAPTSYGMPEFTFPSIDFELPVELSYSFVKFSRPRAPALALSENTESVRKELRSALLESASLVEDGHEETPQLVASAVGGD